MTPKDPNNLTVAERLAYLAAGCSLRLVEWSPRAVYWCGAVIVTVGVEMMGR